MNPIELNTLLYDKNDLEYIFYPKVNFIYPNNFSEKNQAFVNEMSRHFNHIKKKLVHRVERDEILKSLSNVRSLILEVTNFCNSRCRYCVYSGKFHDRRIHGDEKMEWLTAKAAIDFYFDWMVSNDDIRTMPYIPSVGFYGGEPLTNFELIQQSFEYCNEIFNRKIGASNLPDTKIGFGLTTNGLLLNDDIIHFLVSNNFHITISLDGPKEIHDKNRGAGNFDRLIEKIIYLRNHYPDYYKEKVSFSIVYSKDTDLEKIRDFFSQDMFEDSIDLTIGYVTDFFSDIESPVDGINEKRVIDSILEKKKNNYTLSKIEERILTQYFEFSIADIGVKSFFGSYCTLGSKKVFVHVNGDFFGCEKTSDSFKIGSIHDGFDLDRIMEIEEEWIEKTVMCNGCILQGNCHACVGCCGVENKLEFEDYCKKKRELFLHRIKDYIEFRKSK